jgi:MFS family permease
VREPPDRQPSAFSRKPFALFWLARVCSMLGFHMTGVAVGWDVYAKTGSPVSLGLVGLFQFLPMVLLMFYAGHVADRYDRRLVAMLCHGVEALAIAVLAAGTLTGNLSVPAIYAAVTLLGAARTFEMPAMASLLPATVPLSLLPRAIASATSATQTAVILGPALGGLLYGQSPPLAYLVGLALFITAGLMLTRISLPARLPPRGAATLRSMFSGLTFIRQRPILLGAISMDLFAVLLGGATALLPIYARDILHVGPAGMGALRSAPAAGALCVSFVLARRPLRQNAGGIMFLAVGAFGISTVIFGASSNMLLSLCALAILGAADNISVVIRNSLVQLMTPDEMRGRVNAVFQLFTGTSNQLGEFESGMTAALLGTVPSVILGGVATVFIAIAWSVLFPDLKRVQRLSATGH